MSARHIWASDSRDPELRAARAAGWRRADLIWERLQQAGLDAVAAGDRATACRCFRRALWLGRIFFPRDDPRRATGLANAAFADRLLGRHARASRGYAAALAQWRRLPAVPAGAASASPARSSLFHLRMERLHGDTYRAARAAHLADLVAETETILAALSQNREPASPTDRRRRPGADTAFDPARKLTAACLLLATP